MFYLYIPPPTPSFTFFVERDYKRVPVKDDKPAHVENYWKSFYSDPVELKYLY